MFTLVVNRCGTCLSLISCWSVFLALIKLNVFFFREKGMQKVIGDALVMMVMKDFQLLLIVEDGFCSAAYALDAHYTLPTCK
jgi:hypothetical protein